MSVKSALQRARARLGALGLTADAVPEPAPDDLLDRYVAAFADADVAALTALLRADATLEMPPYANWFSGRDDVLTFLAARMLDGRIDAAPTSANGQPAVAIRMDGEPHALQVLDIRDGLVAGIVVFLDPDSFTPFAGSVRHDPG